MNLIQDFRKNHDNITNRISCSTKITSIDDLYNFFLIEERKFVCDLDMPTSTDKYEYREMETQTIYYKEDVLRGEKEKLAFLSSVEFLAAKTILNNESHHLSDWLEKFNLEHITVNYRTKKVFFVYDVVSYNFMPSQVEFLEFEGYGLTAHEYRNLETWQAVLLQSASIYYEGLISEAFLSAFSALDTLIGYITEEFNKLMKDYLDDYVPNLDRDIIPQKSNLIKEKLKSILKYSGILLENNGDINNIYSDLVNYTKDRNDLAHANISALDTDNYWDLVTKICVFSSIIFNDQ